MTEQGFGPGKSGCRVWTQALCILPSLPHWRQKRQGVKGDSEIDSWGYLLKSPLLSSQGRSASPLWHDCTIEMRQPVLLCLMLPMLQPSAIARDGNRTWTASSHCLMESLYPACSWPTRYVISLGNWPLASLWSERKHVECSVILGIHFGFSNWQNHLCLLSRDVETFSEDSVD